MDGTLHSELDASDIIAGIMHAMEEVMDLIHRPGSGRAAPTVQLVMSSIEAEPSSIQDIS